MFPKTVDDQENLDHNLINFHKLSQLVLVVNIKLWICNFSRETIHLTWTQHVTKNCKEKKKVQKQKNRRGGRKKNRNYEKALTHCGMQMDQTQGEGCHSEQAPSAKYESKKEENKK